ncbi:adenylate/guanylate cyclase domain-containing protein [Ruegeria sp. 1NDH52C]|uniref:Adenylate/guanylate cyclase domain-containing protein n=1 Tax=Ruegeria alba TaxID=2916756 RepID=A0ABS9P2A0_9RHOB|nr:adenylate/guanylate cyclase domain-containing protein [Ruegeria alba]MCG6560609.1 adenylate/guanylate cyclase domain-containing protein [Ruegeria alba]
MIPVFRQIGETLSYTPQNLSQRTARLYLLSKIGYPLGLVYHAVAVVMFHQLNAMPLVYYNIVSLIAFGLCVFITLRFRNITVPFLIGPVVEMPVHAGLATLAFGLNSCWFLWALTPAVLVFWMPIELRVRVAISCFSALIFVAVGLVGILWEPWYEIPIFWLSLFVIFNLVGNALTFCILFALNTEVAANAEDALEAEYARSETLLYNLLPEDIAARLKLEPDRTIADSLPKVAILFADIVNFTPRSAQMQPEEIVEFLNRIFTEFDHLAEKHGLEKIKTIGDAYMVAAGMPKPVGDPVHRVAEMALDMLKVAETLPDAVELRIGLHAGPAVAGVIGNRKLFYDVWGETVNTASRMESHGEPGRIQVTEAAKAELDGRYIFESRGTVEVKGMGPIETWWLAERSRSE